MKLVNLTLKIGLLRTTTQRRTYSVRLLHACTEVILFIFHTYLKKNQDCKKLSNTFGERVSRNGL